MNTDNQNKNNDIEILVIEDESNTKVIGILPKEEKKKHKNITVSYKAIIAIVIILSVIVTLISNISYAFYGKDNSIDNNTLEKVDEIETEEINQEEEKAVESPELDVINEKIFIDSDVDFDIYSNLIYDKEKNTVKCDNDKLEIGTNNIVCTATNSNGDSITKSFSVIKSTTFNKTAIFFGDSITSGFGSSNRKYSWANYIDDNYDLSACVNAGKNAYRVSTYNNEDRYLVKEVKKHYNEEYDFVILQGGINDALYKIPIGTLSNTNDTDALDTNTFYGGLEMYIVTAINTWPNARIGYIINYSIPNYDSIIYDYNHFKKYYDALKEVLKKYNISYIDLFEGSAQGERFSDILSVNSKVYLIDNLHLNDEGYKKISPYIYNWMQTLEKYSITR